MKKIKIFFNNFIIKLKTLGDLFNILWEKEIIHWKRTKRIFNRFQSKSSKYTFGVIVIFIGILLHYCFVLMATLWELFLFIVAYNRYQINIQNMYLTVAKNK